MKNLDPRTKLLLVVCFTTLAVLAKDIIHLAIVFGFTLITVLLFKTNTSTALNRIKGLISVIIFITVVQSLTVKGGVPLIHIGKVNIVTSAGLIMGLEFMLRMGIIILASLIAGTSDGSEMIDGLIKLKLPYELAFMTSIALRFIPLFREEFSNRINAIAMRGIEVRKLKLDKKIKVYSYLISPTVTSCVLKSRDLSTAMVARGFSAYPERTMLRNLKLTFSDYFVIIFTLSCTAVFLTFMYTKGGII